MAIVVTLNDTLAAIVKEVEKLPLIEQHRLLISLKKDYLNELSDELKKDVKPGKKLSDEEIADRVRSNRKKWKKT